MKFSILQPDLLTALSAVAPAVAKRPVLPVLAHVLLDAHDGRLEISGTDLEQRIDVSACARIEEGGAFTIPFRLAHDLVKAFPSERIDLELRDNALHLECAKSEADVKGIDADEYPLPPTVNEDPVKFKLPACDLLDAARLVALASADDESRPILTGVHIRSNGGENEPLVFAAADGFRLAVLEIPPSELRNWLPMSVTVPSKALADAAKLTDAAGPPVTLVVGHSFVRFAFEGATLTTQVLEGNFVNYKQIIPNHHDTQAVVDRRELVRALQSAAVVVKTDDAKVAHFRLAASDGYEPGLVNVSTVNEGGDEFEAELDATVTGASLDVIAFGIPLLLDPLRGLNCDEVAIQTTQATRPGVVKPVGEKTLAYTYVIMPMHVRSE